MKYLLVALLTSCGMNNIKAPPVPLNGEPGRDGAVSTLNIIPFISTPLLCPSGSGIRIQVLLDGAIQSESILCDGQDGVSSPYQITEVIDPCGATPGYYNEVLLRLGTGEIVASFSNNVAGDYTRLAIVPPGTYMTSDGTNCVFTVGIGGEVTW